MPFYDRGQVRIHYEEVGSGFPLLVIPGGGLNSTVAGLATHPFNPFDEFKGEFRVIAADLRNAKGGQSSGPFEVDRPWDAYTDDHIGLMDHLGIREFMVLGFCIGGPFIWNLLKRAGDRVVAAVPAQPSGYRPEMPGLSCTDNMKGWGPELCAHRPDITMAMVDTFLTNMYGGARADFVYTVTHDFVRSCQTPILVLPDDVPGPPLCGGDGDRASGTQCASEPLSVEGHPRQDSVGGAPYPHLSPRPSTFCGRAIFGSSRPVAPDKTKAQAGCSAPPDKYRENRAVDGTASSGQPHVGYRKSSISASAALRSAVVNPSVNRS
jgi:pimeloyl-ACP methyl ester carboxylesterase